MTDENSGFIPGAWFGAIFIAALAWSHSKDYSEYKKVENVQAGYVATSKLEVTCEDLDKTDGRDLPETYLTLDGRKYLVMYDKNGKPALFNYTYKPAKIIPANVIPITSDSPEKKGGL